MSLAKAPAMAACQQSRAVSCETSIATSSSSPSTANQELGRSWSEGQTSLAPPKRAGTVPPSNELECWISQLCVRTGHKLFPLSSVMVSAGAVGSCACQTQRGGKELSALTHLCLGQNPALTLWLMPQNVRSAVWGLRMVWCQGISLRNTRFVLLSAFLSAALGMFLCEAICLTQFEKN